MAEQELALYQEIISSIEQLRAKYMTGQPDIVSVRDGIETRQYGDFSYEYIGSFERSTGKVFIVEIDTASGNKLAEYTMSSDSYGRHIDGPRVEYDMAGKLRRYMTFRPVSGSDETLQSDIVTFNGSGEIEAVEKGDLSNLLFEEWKKSFTSKVEQILKRAPLEKVPLNEAKVLKQALRLNIISKQRAAEFQVEHMDTFLFKDPLSIVNNHKLLQDVTSLIFKDHELTEGQAQVFLRAIEKEFLPIPVAVAWQFRHNKTLIFPDATVCKNIIASVIGRRACALALDILHNRHRFSLFKDATGSTVNQTLADFCNESKSEQFFVGRERVQFRDYIDTALEQIYYIKLDELEEIVSACDDTLRSAAWGHQLTPCETERFAMLQNETNHIKENESSSKVHRAQLISKMEVGFEKVMNTVFKSKTVSENQGNQIKR